MRMGKIDRINIPSPSIRQIPRPEIRDIPPPVIRGIRTPTVDVPTPIVPYPTLDVPTEQEFRGQIGEQQTQQDNSEDSTRSLPSTPPTINIGGVEAPLPPVGPLITAGATAVVTTVVALGATIAINQVKTAMEPFLKRLLEPKKKKVKIKQKKPVLHYVSSGDKIDIFEYSAKGTRLVESIQDVERYLRDQVEIDSLYEYDNKIIIDDVIKSSFTKEGTKRFKSLFVPAKTIVKKLSCRFSI